MSVCKSMLQQFREAIEVTHLRGLQADYRDPVVLVLDVSTEVGRSIAQIFAREALPAEIDKYINNKTSVGCLPSIEIAAPRDALRRATASHPVMQEILDKEVPAGHCLAVAVSGADAAGRFLPVVDESEPRHAR